MIYKWDDKKVIFTSEVVETLKQYRQVNDNIHEAGGILLGTVFPDRIEISQVSTPSSEDKSGKYFFNRSVKKAQKIIDEAFQKSGGKLIYLGEWHTHPEAIPIPSFVDRQTINELFKDTIMEIDYILFVIVGINKSFVGIKTRNGLKKLRENSSDKIIQATFYENAEGHFCGFLVEGYSDYGPYGYDIIDASVSALVFTTMNSIVNLTDEKHESETRENYIRFICPNLVSSREKNIQVDLLLQSLFIGLEGIRRETDYIRISVEKFNENVFARLE